MSSAVPDDVEQTSVSAVVLRAARRLALELEAELQAEGLGLDHWLVVDALATTAGLTMAELQSLTLTAGPTQTRVVDRLVTQSLAYREVDALDRRKVRVYLSKRGAGLHRRLIADITTAEARWASSHGRELHSSMSRVVDGI